MANLNLGQNVANKRDKINLVAHFVANSYPLWQAVWMLLYGSLININHLGPTSVDLVSNSVRKSFCPIGKLNMAPYAMDGAWWVTIGHLNR